MTSPCISNALNTLLLIQKESIPHHCWLSGRLVNNNSSVAHVLLRSSPEVREFYSRQWLGIFIIYVMKNMGISTSQPSHTITWQGLKVLQFLKQNMIQSKVTIDQLVYLKSFPKWNTLKTYLTHTKCIQKDVSMVQSML